jgi:hypothetical protein
MANTLAYYVKATIASVRSFIVQVAYSIFWHQHYLFSPIPNVNIVALIMLTNPDSSQSKQNILFGFGIFYG